MRKAFTLIELLVVISIIALLSSVVLSSLNSARSKARDAQRLSDIRQIKNAMELYKNDYGNYPPLQSSNGTGPIQDYALALSPYIKLPNDPKFTDNTSAPSGSIPQVNYKMISMHPSVGEGNNYGILISFENLRNGSYRCLTGDIPSKFITNGVVQGPPIWNWYQNTNYCGF